MQQVRLRSNSRLAGRRTTPPPVAMTERVSSTSVASISDSRSRNACSPLAEKNSAIEQPTRRSIAWSQSAYERARRFAVALPIADLPLPGIPINAIETGRSGGGLAENRDDTRENRSFGRDDSLRLRAPGTRDRTG